MSDWSSDVCSSDLPRAKPRRESLAVDLLCRGNRTGHASGHPGLDTEPVEIGHHRTLEDDEQNQHHHRLQVDAAEIGHAPPERTVVRRGDPVEPMPELSYELIVRVVDVERYQPRIHRRDGNGPPAEVEKDRQNVARKNVK